MTPGDDKMVTQLPHKPAHRAIKTALFAGAAMLACAAASGTAWAGPITTGTASLNQISTSTIGTTSQGTVTLTQNGPTEVDVNVTLVTGAKFVNTSNSSSHTPFAFNLNSSVAGSSSLANIKPPPGASNNPPGFISPTNSQPPVTLGSTNFVDTPYGTFNFGIYYTGGNGSSNGISGPLSFAVTNQSGITIGDFNTSVEKNNNTISTNYYFAADVLGTAGGTGAVAANLLTLSGGGNPVGPSVPEPGSLVLLGTGLVGLGFVTRRKRHRA